MEMHTMTHDGPRKAAGGDGPQDRKEFGYRKRRHAISQTITLAGAFLFFSLGELAAQSAGTRNVYGNDITVNDDVLDSLGSGEAQARYPYPQVTSEQEPWAGAGLHQPGALMFPPPDFPKSQLLHPDATEELIYGSFAQSGASESTPQTPETVSAPSQSEPQKDSSATAQTQTAGTVTLKRADTAAAMAATQKDTDGSAPKVDADAQVAAAEAQPAETVPTDSATQASTGTMVAAASPAAGILTSVTFAANSSDLTEEGKAQLLEVAGQLGENASLRIQLLAYAGADSSSHNAARRLSLSRALAVRGFLIDQGLTAARMQVRALGNRNQGGSPDRVDIRRQGG